LKKADLFGGDARSRTGVQRWRH